MKEDSHKSVKLWNEKGEDQKLHPVWVRVLFWSLVTFLLVFYLVISFFPEDVLSFFRAVTDTFWENFPS
jgi:hypothetical protein